MSEKNKKLRVEYVKSMIGSSRRQRGTMRALGFKRLGDVIEVADNPSVRGMLVKVGHLVQVKEIE
jgi:large subunit ribosomal protein L30